jgi:hypothetical protein
MALQKTHSSEQVVQRSKLDGREHAAMMHEINDFVAMIKKDFSLVTGPWPDNILNIRRKIYKKRHKKIVADRVTTMVACKVDEDMHFMGLDAFQNRIWTYHTTSA